MAENIPKVSKASSFIDEDKNTPLHYAAACGHANEVQQEIEKGHEIDPVNYLDWTPLMMATRYGHIGVIKILLDNHADSTRTNKFGFNVLLMAVACGKLEVLQLILQHLLCGGVSKQSMQRLFSPISIAVLFNSVHVVQYLIEKGFCINAATSVTGITPRMFAGAMGNIEIINLLTKNGDADKRKPMPVEKQMPNPLQFKPSGTAPPVATNIPPPPMMLINGAPYAAQPAFFNVPPNFQMQRRCSDLYSPCFTPNISPLPPGAVVHQVFFSPNFSPSQFVSPLASMPIPNYSNYNDFLNERFMQPGPYYSPGPYNVAI